MDEHATTANAKTASENNVTSAKGSNRNSCHSNNNGRDYASRLARKMGQNHQHNNNGNNATTTNASTTATTSASHSASASSIADTNDDYRSRLARKMGGEHKTEYDVASIDNHDDDDDDNDGPGYNIRDDDDISLEFQVDAPAKSNNTNSNHHSKHNGSANGDEETLPGAHAAEGRALGVNINARRRRREEEQMVRAAEDTSNDNKSLESSNKMYEVVAFAVDDNETTNARASVIRRDIINQAVRAEEVEPVDESTNRLTRYSIWLVLALVVIGVVVGLSVGLTRQPRTTVYLQHESESPSLSPSLLPSLSPSLSPTITPRPVLETVLEDGKLRCAVAGEGIGYYISPKDNKTLEGIEVEMCRAVSGALFNSIDNVDIIITTWADRWEALQNRSIDLHSGMNTHTMERDVYQDTAKNGFSFSTPFLYDGFKFGGVPKFVDCADDMDTYFGICKFTKVCVIKGTTAIEVLKGLLPEKATIITVSTVAALYKGLIDGTCNVIMELSFTISETLVKKAGYNGTYKIGSNRFNNEPLSVVTRQNDPQWTDFVNYVLQSLFWAETNKITQVNATQSPTTDVFGTKHQNMFRNTIAAVGNYAEVYERTLKQFALRNGLNLLNTKGNSGLIQSHPFGSLSNAGPGPTSGGTLQQILQRGYLRCGVISNNRAGFAELNTGTQTWIGLDVDYCKALSASVFPANRNNTATMFVDFSESHEGHAFMALQNNSIDVLSGSDLNLITDVNEPTTGEGYTFSQPYFYSTPNKDKLQ